MATLPPALSAAIGSDNRLTDEQVDFVQGLYNNNVPIPAIARVLERMAQPGYGDSFSEGSFRSLGAPPSYYNGA
jgi:hypothetical protein